MITNILLYISATLVAALGHSTPKNLVCHVKEHDCSEFEFGFVDEDHSILLHTRLELKGDARVATADKSMTKRNMNAMKADPPATRSILAQDKKNLEKRETSESSANQQQQQQEKERKKLMQEAMIPIGALMLGGLLLLGQQTTAGLLAANCGSQTGFSLFMKVVLSDTVVSQELDLKGIPAGFLVTAIQQVVAFAVVVVAISALYFTPYRYTPRKLNSFKELACIFLFALAFSLNIGLNNVSLSLLAVSLNMIIRSCLPLVVFSLQSWFGISKASFFSLEVILMAAGVVCAGIATFAKSESHSGSEGKNLVVGVFLCVLSNLAAATNLIMVSAFKTTFHPPLNPVDTIFYMALPCGIFLFPAVLKFAHPVDWPGYGAATDYEIYMKVMELSPSTMNWVILSGCIAAAYNVLQYTMVQRLAAEHAAFAGNFNKAVAIMTSIYLGLESLPGGVWSTVMLFAILGNIGSFTGYSLLKCNEQQQPKPAENSEVSKDEKLEPYFHSVLKKEGGSQKSQLQS